MKASELYQPRPFGGPCVVIIDPAPVYKQVMMFKRHRKKRNWTRVEVFSHWEEWILTGQVLGDLSADVVHMNRATWDRLEKGLAKANSSLQGLADVCR